MTLPPNDQPPAATTADPVITGYACSPRAHGNSDEALALFLGELTAAGLPTSRLALRNHHVLCCLGCQRCGHPRPGGPGGLGGCVQAPKDQTGLLFAPLLAAPALVFSAPIYFYHLPAGFKAFIDRSQPYYARAQAGDPAMLALPPRLAFVILAAGRPKGERLFEGALLTLKYFLQPFNITLADPCLLRGVDAPGDVSLKAADQVRAHAKQAAALLRTSTACLSENSLARSDPTR